MSKAKGPEFLRFCRPIKEVLIELGGSGRPSEVIDLVIERMNISESEQEVTIKSGESRVKNQVGWARFYMVKADLISSSQRGVWELTEKGYKTELNEKYILKMFKEVQQKFNKVNKNCKITEPVDLGNDINDINVKSVDASSDYKSELLSILQNLSPDGFERICQRLLRESGFQKVVVTGKTGDGGIDGHGILQINPLVSFKVLFQCKRYKGSVAVSTVRDFRGSLQGRADKGIILTTGTFTTDAKNEALRDGATPIELVDGDKLIEMFESLSLGLTPKKDFEINYQFFEQFKREDI